MPFIPHTKSDIESILSELGVDSVERLFDEIPQHLKIDALQNIPAGLSEMEVTRLMQDRAQKDHSQLCFIGAGAYEHHIPAAIWDITARGEFYTAYTPYQAEASQGTLQLLYEFQTMMANLMSMDVANASLYDGASSLAEAILMAVRCQKSDKRKNILVPVTLHPFYRKVVKTIVSAQGIQLQEIPYVKEKGNINFEYLKKSLTENVAAIVIPQPNFFGVLEDVDQLTNLAHQNGVLVIGVVNPLAMSIYKEPGNWGETGADIVCGDAQPFGIPLSSGGPYLGFICCKFSYVRQMPGRIVGRTVDIEGKESFTLTLQAREQHIRRSKATSNICTNQSLLVTAATIYMSLLGAEGLRNVALVSHQNAQTLQKKLIEIEGVSTVFHRPYFHEFVLRFNQPVNKILDELSKLGIQGGYDLSPEYPDLDGCLLICATETKTETDLNLFAERLAQLNQSARMSVAED